MLLSLPIDIAAYLLPDRLYNNCAACVVHARQHCWVSTGHNENPDYTVEETSENNCVLTLPVKVLVAGLPLPPTATSTSVIVWERELFNVRATFTIGLT